MLTPDEIEAYYASAGVRDAKPRGEWRDAKCPLHADTDPSFSFNTVRGTWVCRSGCGGGKMRDFALRVGIPIPRSASRTPSGTEYVYRDEQAQPLYKVVRKNKAGGKKDFYQFKADGKGGWEKGVDGARLVPFRLPELMAADPAQPVFLTEGEGKACDVAALGLVATTNSGGSGKWTQELADHFAGRRLVVMVDADQAGLGRVDKLLSTLGAAADTRVLLLPGLGHKGDVADWISAGGEAADLLEAAAGAPGPQDWRARYAAEIAAIDAWEAEKKARQVAEKAAKDAKAPPAPKAAPGAAQAPFLALGHSDGVFYYLPAMTQQVVALTPGSHGKLNLFHLAPQDYWYKHYGNDQGNIAWDKAAADCMAFAARAGIFDPERIRGRGAWYDRGRPVIHVGDGIIMDGQQQPLGQPEPGGFIYPAALPLRLGTGRPLGPRDASALNALCEMLSWENKTSGRYLAGWLAIAPICGALSWRPHVWIAGAAGSGKSFCVDQVMKPVLGNIRLYVQGDTTEAGIRQALGYDARPILFDEAEGETERGKARIQSVMALMRQSSSDGGGLIMKGSTSGTVKVYCVRSCFAFSSIGVSIKQHSDATRVTVLELKKDEGPRAEENFAEICAATAGLLTPEWIAGLHARMVRLIPQVRANAETFARAVAARVGSRRAGDQMGALLAGAYALHSDKEVTRAQADAYAAKHEWVEQKAIHETPDEVLCWHRLLQHVVRVQNGKGPVEMSVAELIEHGDSAMDPSVDTYAGVLLRMGIKVDREADTVTVANQSAEIQKIMAGTPWTEWAQIMRRLAGAKATPQPVRIGSLKVRGTVIPRKLISN